MKNIFTSILLCLAVTAFAQDTKKDTVKTGSYEDFGARIYDARIGRSMSVDPKASQNSPYNFADKQDTLQQDTASLTFEQLLDLNNMTFEIPKGHKEVKSINNRQMNYEKAYKHPTERFEVRYAIRHHDLKYTKQFFEMTVLNISGGQLPEYTPFNVEAAKNYHRFNDANISRIEI